MQLLVAGLLQDFKISNRVFSKCWCEVATVTFVHAFLGNFKILVYSYELNQIICALVT